MRRDKGKSDSLAVLRVNCMQAARLYTAPGMKLMERWVPVPARPSLDASDIAFIRQF